MENILVAQTHQALVVFSVDVVDMKTGSLTDKVKFNVKLMLL